MHIPRVLTQHRGFSASVILSLGIGISCAAGVAAVVDSMQHGTLPFRNADRLQHLYVSDRSAPNERQDYVSMDVVRAIEAAGSPVEDVATYAPTPMKLRDGARNIDTYGTHTSANFASMLGARMIAGRALDASDANGPPAAMISRALWIESFAQDSAIVGRTIFIDGVSHAITGIVAPEWDFPARSRIWTSDLSTGAQKPSRSVSAIALVRVGVDEAQAKTAISGLGTAVLPKIHGRTTSSRVGTVGFRDFIAEVALRGVVISLGILAVLVAFISAVNFAALVLARGIRRRGEIGVRAALGASVSQLVRHIIGECMILCAAGGVVAAILAPAVLAMLRSTSANLLPLWLDVTLGWRTIVTSILISMIVGIIFGLGPALDLARPALGTFLRSASSTTSSNAGLARTRQSLVAIQVALATGIVVLIASLLGKGLVVSHAWLGYDHENVVTAYVAGDSATVARSTEGMAALLADVRRMPGVANAAIMNQFGLDPAAIKIDGADMPGGPGHFLTWCAVTEDFYAVMRPKLVAGRFPTAVEEMNRAPVAVINRSAVKRLFGADAVGKRIRLAPDYTGVKAAEVTIVGVIDDIKSSASQTNTYPLLFSPLTTRQLPFTVGQSTLWVKTSGPPAPFVHDLQSLSSQRALDAQLYSVQSKAESVRLDLLGQHIFARVIFAIFGIALGLAALGIYSLVSYTAEMRSRELAIREALGASRTQVAGLVLRGAAVQALVGVAAGALLAVIGASMLTQQYGIQIDAAIGATVISMALVALVVLISSIGPLREAWRRDLSYVLRV